MKPQNKRLMLVVIIALIIGALLGVVGYYLVTVFIGGTNNATNVIVSASNIAPVSTTSSVFVSNSGSTSSVSNTNVSSGSTTSNSIPTAIDMSNWKTYTNYELGISFQYPSNLNSNTSNPAAIILTFPSSYFSTAAVDTDIFSVTVSAACAVSTSTSSQSVDIDGVTFTETNQQGATLYEGNSNNVCYTIEYNSDGPVVPATDSANIESIVGDIISTFTFVNTPAGENEAEYSADQNQQSQNVAPTNSGLINLVSVSSSTISVGGNMVLSGSGFSGNNTVVWISNGSVQGVLWNGAESSDTTINTIIPAQVCTQVVGGAMLGEASTLCPSYLVLNSGVYTIIVSNQNGSSEPLYIRIP